jgi:putative addiction module killer protein
LSVLIHSEDGKEPFTKWFNDLRDKKRQASVVKGLAKLRDGHLGDTKSITSKRVDGSVVGLYELKISDGLRVYFRYVNDNRVILLGGGGKASGGGQDRDIIRSAARAALYNGSGRAEAAQLREWSDDDRHADQS